MWYYEWCSDVKTRRGNMVSEEVLNKIVNTMDSTGYSTVYAFSEEDAKTIREQGSSQNFGRFSVGSDKLVIDLDDGEPQLKAAEAKLKELGLGYDVFFSGSKGYHLYIKMDSWIYDKRLPNSQRMFVRSLDIGADETLYQHGRIISNVGRIHKKTGKKKRWLRREEGSEVHIDIVEPYVPEFNFKVVDSEGSLELGLSGLLKSVQFPPSNGFRHQTMFGISADLIRAGLEPETVRELLYKVNDSWDNAKTHNEVDAALVGAIKHVT